jgi:flagellar basal-body rod protein FlgF
MIYGFYRSAAGMMTSTHNVDVIANNLANVETTGFRRQMAIFEQMNPQGEIDRHMPHDPFLNRIGSGPATADSVYDMTGGGLENTSNPLDVALVGDGYLAVRSADGQTRLTRNGEMLIDQQGFLRLATDDAPLVLNAGREPIRIESSEGLNVSKDGEISNITGPVARLGVFSVPEPKQLKPIGQTLLHVPASMNMTPASATVMSGYLERSNVDPASEITRLMQAQRQLEANANMLRYQDQATSRLVTDVGKIG